MSEIWDQRARGQIGRQRILATFWLKMADFGRKMAGFGRFLAVFWLSFFP